MPAPVVENMTVPVGVIGVPGLVSVTVAVHEVGSFTGTELGEQIIEVEVDRRPTETTNCAELDGWSWSPSQLAPTLTYPVETPGVNATEQDEEPALPLRTQLSEGENVPDSFALNDAVPPGVRGVPESVESASSKVQSVEDPVSRPTGAHERDAAVDRCTAEMEKTPELFESSESPGNVALIVAAPSLPGAGV